MKMLRIIACANQKMRTCHNLSWHDDFTGFLLQRGYLLYKNLFLKHHWGFAAQPTFNTLMSIIPIFAIIFAIGKGLGFESYVIAWCRRVFAAQPQVYEAIISLSQSYLQYTHAGIIIGVGLVLMLWSIMSLLMNIESTFCMIWDTDERPLKESLIYYTATIFIAPMAIIFCSIITMYSYSLFDYLPTIQYITSFMRGATGIVLPLCLLWVFFLMIYTIIPHTKVRIRHAWWPSLIAACLIMVLQMAYVHIQMVVTSYNLIYGSLAALPLFLLWLQISWYICIGCAELTHANQELALGGADSDVEYTISEVLAHCLVVLQHITDRQRDDRSPLRFTQLLRLTGYSPSELHRCLMRLEACGYVNPTTLKKSPHDLAFVLGHDSQNIRLEKVIERLMNTCINREHHREADEQTKRMIDGFCIKFLTTDGERSATVPPTAAQHNG